MTLHYSNAPNLDMELGILSFFCYLLKYRSDGPQIRQDGTSRNTAIGRISLDDENLYKLCMFSWLWFLSFFSRTVFAHVMFLGYENSLQT